MHVNEPNCAVKLGLETNKISSSRYESYLSMLDDGASNYRNNI